MHRTIGFLLAGLCAATACKKEERNEPAPSAKGVPAAPAAKGAAPRPLAPHEVDPAKTYGATELHEAFFAWKWDGKRIAVVGYCRVIAEAPVSECTYLAPTAERTTTAVSLRAAPAGSGTVDPATPVVIEGTIEESPFEYLVLRDAKLVSSGMPASIEENPTPWTIDPSKPVPGAAMMRALVAWQGREVTVTGRYDSHTTSTNSYGQSIRVDLSAGGPRLIGCYVKDPPAGSIVNQRDGVVARGKVNKDPFFDQVQLDDCALVNR